MPPLRLMLTRNADEMVKLVKLVMMVMLTTMLDAGCSAGGGGEGDGGGEGGGDVDGDGGGDGDDGDEDDDDNGEEEDDDDDVDGEDGSMMIGYVTEAAMVRLTLAGIERSSARTTGHRRTHRGIE